MMSQRKIFGLSACLAGAMMLFAASSAQALMVVDPDTGGSGITWWFDGAGSSHTFTDFTVGNSVDAADVGADALEITVAHDSLIDFSVLDCCDVGDEFALVLDGSTVAWTTQGFTGVDFGGRTNMFEATVLGLFLSAGSHTLDLLTTAQAPTPGSASGQDNTDIGSGDWSVSAATVVPLPAGLVLLLSALGGLGFVARRRRADAVPA